MGIVSRALSAFQPFRVCMWHTGRCGSSVLADLISSDGRIYWAGELLEQASNEWHEAGVTGSEALRRCRKAITWRRYDAGRSPFGFEMKLWHLHRLGLRPEEMHGLIADLGFGKHIVLERKNYLRQRVSGRLAEVSGRYHLREGEQASAATVRVDLETMMDFFRRCETYYRSLDELLPGHLRLTYEDDVERDPSVAYARVMSQVGLEPRRVTTDRRKTNPRPLVDVIDNFDEVAARLSGTPHEWMLDA